MTSHNLATWDRILRTLAGIPLVVIGWFLGGTLGLVVLIVGAVLLFTAAIGWCALYHVFHIGTKPLASA